MKIALLADTHLSDIQNTPQEESLDWALQQLEILKPKLIITLGEFPTRNLLPNKFKKFSDVVGTIHKVDNYFILPIYHPSPISPQSYKGNVPVFEKLKEWLGEN